MGHPGEADRGGRRLAGVARLAQAGEGGAGRIRFRVLPPGPSDAGATPRPADRRARVPPDGPAAPRRPAGTAGTSSSPTSAWAWSTRTTTRSSASTSGWPTRRRASRWPPSCPSSGRSPRPCTTPTRNKVVHRQLSPRAVWVRPRRRIRHGQGEGRRTGRAPGSPVPATPPVFPAPASPPCSAPARRAGTSDEDWAFAAFQAPEGAWAATGDRVRVDVFAPRRPRVLHPHRASRRHLRGRPAASASGSRAAST